MKHQRHDTSPTTTTRGRRTFLKTAAMAVAAPTIVPSTVFGQNAPSNRITLGCIGTGFQWQWDTSAFLALDDVQIVGLCDVDKERRENSKGVVEEAYAESRQSGTYTGVALYNDYRDMLANPDIDSVIIATPDHWHALIAQAASNAGKAVYCQKPMTYDIREGQVLVDTVRKNKTVFQTGSQQRSMYNFRFACELVRNGRIGELKEVEVGLGGPRGKNEPFIPMPVPDGFDYNLWLGPAPDAPYTEKRCHFSFRWIKDYAYGLVTDWGAHHIDTAQWGMGTELTGPVHVESTADFYTDGLYDTPRAFSFDCTYANGVVLKVGDGKRFKNGIRFIGTDGWVFITRGLGEGDISAEPASILTSVFGFSDIRLYRHRSKRPQITWRPQDIHNTIHHYTNFVDCVKTGAETAAPVECGHRSVTICHLAKASMELGRPINWDPDRERFVNDPEADTMIARKMRSPWNM